MSSSIQEGNEAANVPRHGKNLAKNFIDRIGLISFQDPQSANTAIGTMNGFTAGRKSPLSTSNLILFLEHALHVSLYYEGVTIAQFDPRVAMQQTYMQGQHMQGAGQEMVLEHQNSGNQSQPQLSTQNSSTQPAQQLDSNRISDLLSKVDSNILNKL